jgi:cell wall-associated NlpC family hydrolase
MRGRGGSGAEIPRMGPHLQTEPRPGDLLLFYGGRRLGWWIERATRSPFYHVALYDRDGCVIDAVPQGVVRRCIDDGTTGTRFIVARPPQERGEAALAWASAQIGRRFDALGMLVVLADLAMRRGKLRYRPTRRFTCSHLVTEAYRRAGIDLAPGRDPALVVPADLAWLASPEDVARAWHEGRGVSSEVIRR